MKHLMVADKSLLAGDEVVDLLMEYASLLGRQGSADVVEVAALAPQGDTAAVTLLLNSGVTMVAESTHSSLPEPDNTEVVERLRSRIERLGGAADPSPEDVAGAAVWNDRAR